MQVVLHIGMNKTGSSTIQEALFRSRQALAEVGVLYPETGLGDADEGFGYHYKLTKALGFSNTPWNRGDGQRQAAQMKSSLLREIELAQPRFTVVSSEYFSLKRDMTLVREFFGGMSVKVVVYLRRHDSWIRSLYAQALKTVPGDLPWSPGFQGYVDWALKDTDMYQKHGELLDAWSAIFGDSNITVRPFEKESLRSNLVVDFLQAAGIAVPPFIEALPTGHANVSPDAARLRKMELARRGFLEDGELDVTDDLMDETLKGKILSSHIEDYEYIARRYLPEGDGRLFRAP